MNKDVYKIFLNLIKYLPLIQALFIGIILTLSCLGIYINIINSLIGISLITLIFYYISSYLFKFCKIHRLGIHCLSTIWLLETLDSIFKFQITNGIYLLIVLIIYILFISYYIYLKYEQNIDTTCQ